MNGDLMRVVDKRAPVEHAPLMGPWRTRAIDGLYSLYHFARHAAACLHVWDRVRLPRWFARLKTSDTLFILGSGASLNDLTRRDWDYIDQHDVAGLSFACLHPIHETFYILEALDPRVPGELKIAQVLNEHLYARVAEGRIGAVVLKDKKAGARSATMPASPYYVMPEVNLTTDNPADLRRVLQFVFRSGLHRYCLFKKRSGIVSAALFGLALGYRRIVFCGVDLNQTRYYFEDAARYPQFQDLPAREPEHDVHRTALPELGMPVDAVIQAINDVITSSTRFYVASKRSKLAEFLDVFDFEAEHQSTSSRSRQGYRR